MSFQATCETRQVQGSRRRVEKADIQALPFADDSFDRVVIEGVTMFADADGACLNMSSYRTPSPPEIRRTVEGEARLRPSKDNRSNNVKHEGKGDPVGAGKTVVQHTRLRVALGCCLDCSSRSCWDSERLQRFLYLATVAVAGRGAGRIAAYFAPGDTKLGLGPVATASIDVSQW